MSDEKQEIIKAGTRPLPYVQVGMRVRHPSDSATWWEVECVREDVSATWREETVAVLRSSDVRRMTVVTEIVRGWTLAEDFEPDEAMERGERRALAEIDSEGERRAAVRDALRGEIR